MREKITPIDKLKDDWSDLGDSITKKTIGSKKQITKGFKFSIDQYISIGDICNHFFGKLVPDRKVESGFLYDKAITTPKCDPLKLAVNNKNYCSRKDYLNILKVLTSMQCKTSRIKIPDIYSLRNRAKMLYSTYSSIPISILHIEFEYIEKIPFSRIGISKKLRLENLFATSIPKLSKQTIFLISPLIDVIPARKFNIVFPEELFFSNTNNRISNYSIGLPSKKNIKLKLNHPIEVESRSTLLPFYINTKKTSKKAISWIHIINTKSVIPDTQIMILRQTRRKR